MKVTPAYRASQHQSASLTEEELEAQAAAKEAARATAIAKAEAEAAAIAKANGQTVTLSEKSLTALFTDLSDDRIRRNIQWGVVRGMFLYTPFMIPVAIVLGIIIAAMNSR